MMFACVQSVPGSVSAVSATLAKKTDHAELGGQWYPCGANVTVGWSFDGSGFTAPPVASDPVESSEPPSAEAVLVQNAMNALTKSDITVIRYYAAGIAVPLDFQNYRARLRAIVNGSDNTSTALPLEPNTFVQGT